VLEVDTPALSCAGATDPAIHSYHIRQAPTAASSGEKVYLHTSPEFPMKRLLAAGSGSIYQICKVFRDGEQGALHNPEFTMLEWYRVGFDHVRLMQDVENLLRHAVGALCTLPATQHLSYGRAFEQLLGIDPHLATASQLREVAERADVGYRAQDADRDLWLDLLFSHCVQPALPPFTFLYDYPASQAALARLRPGTPSVAERFELFMFGVELANGFHELSDAREQRTRFEAERRKRARCGLPDVAQDERLLAALEQGIPDCAGVALGVDRLLLSVIGARDLAEVIAFPMSRA
jgi:lysyl-tRNA synthetase class 2